MLVPCCEIIDADITNIYIDSLNMIKVRVTLGGSLIGVATAIEYNSVYDMYCLKLFKDPFEIPLSATNCNPFLVEVVPFTTKLPVPKVWLETVEGKHKSCDILKEFAFTLLDGQSGKLVATHNGQYRFLVPEAKIKDTSFSCEHDATTHSIFSSYEAAFKSTDEEFVKFFAYGFGKTLPYITEREAAALALSHEKNTLIECLRQIWSSYQKTDAYSKACTL